MRPLLIVVTAAAAARTIALRPALRISPAHSSSTKWVIAFSGGHRRLASGTPPSWHLLELRVLVMIRRWRRSADRVDDRALGQPRTSSLQHRSGLIWLAVAFCQMSRDSASVRPPPQSRPERRPWWRDRKLLVPSLAIGLPLVGLIAAELFVADVQRATAKRPLTAAALVTLAFLLLTLFVVNYLIDRREDRRVGFIAATMLADLLRQAAEAQHLVHATLGWSYGIEAPEWRQQFDRGMSDPAESSHIRADLDQAALGMTLALRTWGGAVTVGAAARRLNDFARARDLLYRAALSSPPHSDEADRVYALLASYSVEISAVILAARRDYRSYAGEDVDFTFEVLLPSGVIPRRAPPADDARLNENPAELKHRNRGARMLNRLRRWCGKT